MHYTLFPTHLQPNWFPVFLLSTSVSNSYILLIIMITQNNRNFPVSKEGVISGPYFPVFGLNTGKSPYSVPIQENMDQQ